MSFNLKGKNAAIVIISCSSYWFISNRYLYLFLYIDKCFESKNRRGKFVFLAKIQIYLNPSILLCVKGFLYCIAYKLSVATNKSKIFSFLNTFWLNSGCLGQNIQKKNLFIITISFAKSLIFSLSPKRLATFFLFVLLSFCRC